LLPLSHTILSVSGSGRERDLALLSEIGDRETYVRGERPHQHDHLLAGHELLGHAHGVARRAVIVTRNDFHRTVEHTAAGVDLG
jgi:hypothetical protein